MNRTEALRILGLDEDATLDDIKAAYKETAQILHPDRFATNKKLQDRATEQFKNLQEAYEYLTSGKGSRTKAARAASASRAYAPTSELEARLAGIAAARTQLVRQRDVVYDERRNGLAMAGIGAVVAILFRKPGPLLILATAGITAVVWGVIQAVGAQRTLSTLSEHIDELNAERRRLESELEDLE
ncbi:molecular chaperone DnaJ [Gordonibacter sp. 28C]|uniref:J domain-containing protein n=1 Tax=Gordonibacter sp. 28C TaxID=2078569 RepID=UPI000DF817DF|nr:J domain-containing protein [Gordonibacter sp. 28C]RDB59660.1 molecular chaperone DnaJ [Gordonibacter sp. 28C]